MFIHTTISNKKDLMVLENFLNTRIEKFQTRYKSNVVLIGLITEDGKGYIKIKNNRVDLIDWLERLKYEGIIYFGFNDNNEAFLELRIQEKLTKFYISLITKSNRIYFISDDLTEAQKRNLHQLTRVKLKPRMLKYGAKYSLSQKVYTQFYEDTTSMEYTTNNLVWKDLPMDLGKLRSNVMIRLKII